MADTDKKRAEFDAKGAEAPKKGSEADAVARAAALAMAGVWATRPVDEQPELTLVRWRVMETERGERHFVGWNVEDREGRVSSAIQSFDPALLRGVTRSGRVYQLSGAPGCDPDAAHVWGVWVKINKVTLQKDVTEEIASGAGEEAAGEEE